MPEEATQMYKKIKSLDSTVNHVYTVIVFILK